MVVECRINGCNPNIGCEWANHLNQCYCHFSDQWHAGCPEFQCTDYRKYGPNCDQTCSCPGALCNNNGICTQCFKTYTGQKCEICACQNGGNCDRDQCTCPAGFSGEFCQISKCDSGISHYNSMADKCECHKIYEGPNCRHCKCRNGGVCKDAKCKCTIYFKSEFCEVDKCGNGGSFNGKNCTCPENYNGTFCEKPKCRQGRRVLEGISNYFCNCPKNYDGMFCENCKCKNGGTCAFDGCECPPSFEGDFCEQPKCQNGRRINFGDLGKCTCPSEFSGVFCENLDIENTIFFGKKKRLHIQYPKQRNKF